MNWRHDSNQKKVDLLQGFVLGELSYGASLNCSGSPQPQNYTAAVGFRCNWLGSILDDTIRAASKQNGIGYKKLNNLAHNMNPSISPKCIHCKSCRLAHSYVLTDFKQGEVYSSPADYIQIDRQLQNMQNLQFHNSYYDIFWQRGLHCSRRPEEQGLLSLKEQICEEICLPVV